MFVIILDHIISDAIYGKKESNQHLSEDGKP